MAAGIAGELFLADVLVEGRMIAGEWFWIWRLKDGGGNRW